MTARFSWVVLGALLAALLVAAASFDRRSWPALVGDEATYLMQAESLAFDFDLRYERRDFDRFRQHWGRLPEGLILQSPDRGAHFTFGKPASYSLYLAPFVRISPTRGPSVANALLLAAAALCSAFTLRHTVGRAAPLWVAVFVFASVAFTQVFWAHMDLFLMCTGALALALANLPEAQTAGALPEIWGEPAPAGRRPWRWAATGAMLAVAAAARPQYGALFLPGLLAVPKSERRSGWMALGLGAATVGLVAVAGSYFWNGSWTPYGGERLGFYSYTGFPLVDLKESWPSLVASRGRGSWIAPGHLLPYGFDAHLSAYNALYLLLGRNVGLLPYYLPLVLGLLAYRPGRGRWALPLAALAATAVFVAIRPFNFWGGGAAVANRYFLPLYPAFWFLPGKPRSPLLPTLVALAAAPFLYPSWLEPRAFPTTAAGGYHHVSAQARAWLPYETTQDHLKPSGQEDVAHNGLWVKPLGPEVRVEDGGRSFRLDRATRGELLVGSPSELAGLTLEILPGGPAEATLNGRAPTRRTLEPSGSVILDFPLGRPIAVHGMWWDGPEVRLYQLKLESPAAGKPLAFRFRPGSGGG